MSDYGINVSRSGYDATDLIIGSEDSGFYFADPSKSIFSSGWFLYKIVATGTLTFPIASTLGTARLDSSSVAHGLSYTPMVSMYFSVDGGTTWWPANAHTEALSSSPDRSCWIESDATNISITAFSENLAAHTMMARYVIYADPVDE